MATFKVAWWHSPERRAVAEFEAHPVEHAPPNHCLGCAGDLNESLCKERPLCASGDVIFKQVTRAVACP